MDGLGDRWRQIQELHQVATAAREAARGMSFEEQTLLLRDAHDLEKEAQLLQKLLEATPYIGRG